MVGKYVCRFVLPNSAGARPSWLWRCTLKLVLDNKHIESRRLGRNRKNDLSIISGAPPEPCRLEQQGLRVSLLATCNEPELAGNWEAGRECRLLALP